MEALSKAKEALLTVLGEHYKESVGHIRDEDGPMLAEIAQAAAMYAVKRAAGDEGAAKDLEHCAVQAKLLAAKVLVREQKDIRDTLLAVVKIGGEIAAQLLLRIPVA